MGTLTSWNPLGHFRPVTGLLYLFINMSHNLGTLTSWNPLGHFRPVTGLLYLFINMSLNLGTLTSWNPLGHFRPVTGLLYLYLYYRPGQVLRVPEGWGSQISKQSAYEGGKVVSPRHRPTFPLLIYVRGWDNPKIIARPDGLCQWKIPMTLSAIETATFRVVAPPHTPTKDRSKVHFRV